jgi:hypothetical protein
VRAVGATVTAKLAACRLRPYSCGETEGDRVS